MKYFKITPLILSCLLLAACSDGGTNKAEKSVESTTEQPIALGTDIAAIIAADEKPEPLSTSDTDAQNIE